MYIVPFAVGPKNISPRWIPTLEIQGVGEEQNLSNLSDFGESYKVILGVQNRKGKQTTFTYLVQ